MPELPEVETVRRQLAHRLNGAQISRVEILHSGREFPKKEAFVKALIDQRIQSVDRRAKLLIWRLQKDAALTAHLKMTGRFVFVDAAYVPGKHDHVLFHLKAKKKTFFLVWADVRKFGFLKIVGKQELEDILRDYGPEPLEGSAKELAESLKTSSKRSIKALLLDQAVLAGVGNIYADEALHRAGIRPTRRAARLSLKERFRLAQEIQNVLRESIDQQGTSANDYVDTNGQRGGFLDLLRVYGRRGEPCRTCRTLIKKRMLAQRGTCYCPVCQK